MKKIAVFFASAFLAAHVSTALAEIQVATFPSQPYNGHDYVGTIVAAAYSPMLPTDQNDLLIITTRDDKMDRSDLKGLSLRISGKDLPFGLTLANSVGKKVAVLFTNANFNIGYVAIVTDTYWNGGDDLKLKLK